MEMNDDVVGTDYQRQQQPLLFGEIPANLQRKEKEIVNIPATVTPTKKKNMNKVETNKNTNTNTNTNTLTNRVKTKIKGKQKQKKIKKKQKDDDNDKLLLFDKTTTTLDTESFSACILFMDDNHRLEEWLAYHYYIMKLRYVVIAVDHYSKQSPQQIVDRWNDDNDQKLNHNLNMTIVTWTDTDYISSSDYQAQMKIIDKAKAISLNEYGNKKTFYYLYRQHEFYRMCSIHLLEQNKTWVSYHDTDEFITFRHWQRKKPGYQHFKRNPFITKKGIQNMKQPGYFLDALNSIKRQIQQIPTTSSSHNHSLKNDTDTDTGMFSCLSIPRRRYCSNELTDDETKELLVPTDGSDGIIPENLFRSSTNDESSTSTINDNEVEAVVLGQAYNNTIQRFDTLRYKYITHNMNGQRKSFINLSQQNPRLYLQNQYQPGRYETPLKWETHSPMYHLCKNEHEHRALHVDIENKILNKRFILNHYSGSWASYSLRDDARRGGTRSYQTWLKQSNDTNGEYSHIIRPWLQSFVTMVGVDVASYLLQDAGKFPHDHMSNLTTRMNDYAYTYKYKGKF